MSTLYYLVRFFRSVTGCHSGQDSSFASKDRRRPSLPLQCAFVVLLLFLLISSAASAQLDVRSNAAVLLDGESGQILYSRRAQTRLSIASLTKMMALLLAAEQLEAGRVGADTRVTVTSAAAAAIPVKIGYTAGEKVTFTELMHAAALYSANDAARALAIYLGGSEAAFAAWMTRRAAAMGLDDTSFTDSTGLSSAARGNFSTAYDLARLARSALQNSTFTRLVSTRTYTLPSRNRQITNFNRLLFEYEGATGIKTGTTSAAGYCLAASAERRDWPLIAIVLGAASSDDRYITARSLFDWAYANFRLVVRKGEVVGEVPVKDRAVQVDLVAAENVRVYRPEGQPGEIRRVLKVPESVAMPVAENERIGELVVLQDGKEVRSIDVLARRTVRRTNFLAAFFQWLLDLLGLL